MDFAKHHKLGNRDTRARLRLEVLSLEIGLGVKVGTRGHGRGARL